MSVVLNLPTEVCHVVLVEWLRFGDWVYLDGAVCNKKYRPILQQQFKLLYSPEIEKSFVKEMTEEERQIILDKLMQEGVSAKSQDAWPKAYNWIHLKEIKLRHMNLMGCFFDRKGQLIIPAKLDFVQSLIFNEEAGRYGAPIVNACRQLKSLDVSPSELVLYVNRNICAGLQRIVLFSQGSPGELSVTAYLADNCRNLKYFTFISGFSGCSDNIASILKFNEQLEYLDFTDGNIHIPAIQKYCKNLTYLNLEIPTTHLYDLIPLFKKNPLRYLKVNASGHFVEYNCINQILMIRNFADENAIKIKFLNLFSNLQSIELIELWDMNDAIVDAILSHSATSLTTLKLLECPNLTVSVLQRLLKQCKNLIVLELSHHNLCNNDVVRLFSVKVPSFLKRLYLNSSVEMNTATINYVLKTLSPLALQRFEFASVSVDKQATTSQKAELAAFSKLLSTSGEPIVKVEWV